MKRVQWVPPDPRAAQDPKVKKVLAEKVDHLVEKVNLVQEVHLALEDLMVAEELRDVLVQKVKTVILD